MEEYGRTGYGSRDVPGVSLADLCALRRFLPGIVRVTVTPLVVRYSRQGVLFGSVAQLLLEANERAEVVAEGVR